MARQMGDTKTCNRCGRSGSHAFRRTSDGLYECTTTTACRARMRRIAGARQDGRGRLPKQLGFTASGPGVAYVIGQDGPERDLVARVLGDVTDLAVAAGDPTKATLVALGSRNVKLIAVAAECLESIGFRNEFALRCRQPRLGSVPVFVYGRAGMMAPATAWMPDAWPIPYRRAAEIGVGLRRQLQAAQTDRVLEYSAG